MSTAPRRPAHRVPSDGAGHAGALDWPVAIGTGAERAGVSARMLRHYESLGLLTGVARTDSGYRQYTEADVHTLRFIRRARDLGFSMEEIACSACGRTSSAPAARSNASPRRTSTI